MSVFTSANTVAVIVGIEDYEISKALEPDCRWDLDGPASDAVRFAQWLRGREVPSTNIHVMRSALAPEACDSKFRLLGITNFHDAKQNTLENFFSGTLRRLAPDEDGQLFVLWGGHGILTASEERHLYCADVLPETVRTIWLNDLLRLLRQMVQFKRQYIFVDACANAHEDTDLREPLFHAIGPQKPPNGVEQYALLAASAGQLAVNQRDQHAGLFSTFLFEAIEPMKDRWPDFTKLEKIVLNRFAQRYAADPTFDQRPVSITVVDHTNHSETHNLGGTPVPRSLQILAETIGYSVGALQKIATVAARCKTLTDLSQRRQLYTKFAFSVPSFRDDDYDRVNLMGQVVCENHTKEFLKELKTKEPDLVAYAELSLSFQQAELARNARTVLRDLKIETSEYQRIFSLVLPNIEAFSLEEILDRLVTKGPIERSLLFEFIFRVADAPKCIDPEPLRAWVRQNAEPQYCADLEQRQDLGRFYGVLISIKPRSGKDELPESFSVWLLENGRFTGKMWVEVLTNSRDRDAAMNELTARLEVALERAIESAEGEVQVEMAVPIGLMRLKFDQLGIKHRNSKFKLPIGKYHPVVIRWRDRQKFGAVWSSPWRLASASIRARLGVKDPHWLSWPPAPDETYLAGLENPPAEFLFVANSQPPVREEDPDWLQEIIIAGIPFAGWMVTSVTNPDNIPSLLDELLKGQFDLLPRRVPEVRRDPQCRDLHPLILLWDDPERRHTVLLEEPS
jgi:hypothetical protein